VIIVTGGAGFIGSNLIHQLNRAGERDILLVDNFAPAPNLTGPKFLNLAGAEYADYMDKREFRAALKSGDFESAKVRAILHQGACSNTLEDDGRYMMDNNFTYSKELLHFALDRKIPLVYASTAAIYGASAIFSHQRASTERLRLFQARLRQLRSSPSSRDEKHRGWLALLQRLRSARTA
jgi:ADP-L-glycero-D-manno-heptose 6-epimerase